MQAMLFLWRAETTAYLTEGCLCVRSMWLTAEITPCGDTDLNEAQNTRQCTSVCAHVDDPACFLCLSLHFYLEFCFQWYTMKWSTKRCYCFKPDLICIQLHLWWPLVFRFCQDAQCDAWVLLNVMQLARGKTTMCMTTMILSKICLFWNNAVT